ncbi:MAG: hypothetical protein OMM_12102 [Candidatus Magnetoglobus multicellularis str. Araruama]|uniref:Uncharacterized protein n=1 Tax=Candidatus Magnetoglobus multicellularis str. Araruama TaxID=890399 RepID=A0A1V1NWQ7_9BACT|nr:MAG: hypothetical protein OMM_12102 [Candidatus Magnetoglobus multicellularis str. Araruama]
MTVNILNETTPLSMPPNLTYTIDGTPYMLPLMQARDFVWQADLIIDHTFADLEALGNFSIIIFDEAQNMGSMLYGQTNFKVDTMAPIAPTMNFLDPKGSATDNTTTLTTPIMLADSVGVTAWLLSEHYATAPTANNPAWLASQPYSYTFVTNNYEEKHYIFGYVI